MKLEGTGWTPWNPAALRDYGIFWDSLSRRIGSFRPDSSGYWTQTVTVPADAKPGKYVIIACEGVQGQWTTCRQVPFEVTAPPTPTPTRTPTPTNTPTPTPTPGRFVPVTAIAPPTYGVATATPTLPGLQATIPGGILRAPAPFGTPLPLPTPAGQCADLGLGPEAG